MSKEAIVNMIVYNPNVKSNMADAFRKAVKK